MTADRWRVAGLATPQSDWFFELARWSTAAAIEVDFVKCVSVAEVRARFAAGETYSALLIGVEVSGLDRTLITESVAHGTAVVVVGETDDRQWTELGAAAVLPEHFKREDLVSLLAEHALPVGAAEKTDHHEGASLKVGWQGRLIVVTGSGGSGVSLLSMALARGLAADASNRGLVLLADLALNADQAVLHDSRDAIGGLQELVEACHEGWIGRDRLSSIVLEPAGRGYQLLLGLRRHRDWTSIRQQTLETALGGLARTYRFVVADTEADTEGEVETGSAGVASRNRLARTAVAFGDLVVVVGNGDMLGLYSLVRTIVGLADSDVSPDRLLPVINRVSRRRRGRADTAAALSELLQNTAADGIGEPVFVAERRDVEVALRDGVAPPAALGQELAAAVVSKLRSP